MASQRVHGITIDIGMNTSGVAEGFSDINKQLNSTSRELKSIDKLLKDDEQNITLLSQKQGLLADQIQKTTEKLRDLYKAKEQADKDDSIDRNSRQYRELERDIEATEKALYNLNIEASKTDHALDDAQKGAEDFGNSLQQTGQDVVKFSSLLLANLLSDAIIGGINLLVDSMKDLSQEVLKWADEFRELEVFEKQFENNIRNTADATDEEIQALKKLASAKERQGVISKKAIMSGYQELATYVESTEAVEGLTDALLDMSAQQYGVDATEESVRNIATTLGKALANGDYSGLTRLGYGFTEAQERIMKYGDELERVAVINDVISQSIGGMNEALAQTDAGVIFNISNTFNDLKQNVGELVSDLEVRFLEGIAPRLQEIIDAISVWVEEHKDEMYEFIDQLVAWLTGDEMDQFFQNMGDMIEDVLEIIANVIELIAQFHILEAVMWAVKQVLDLIKSVTSAIVSDIRFIKENGIGAWAMGNYNSYSASGGDYFSMGSGGFGDLLSGGFKSGGIVVNASFVINEATMNRNTIKGWGYELAEAINNAMGDMV